jgi:hypothetical protein
MTHRTKVLQTMDCAAVATTDVQKRMHRPRAGKD